MTQYLYKARSKTGELVTGELEGGSPTAIKETLARQGLYPISVTSQGILFGLDRFFERPLPLRGLVSMTRQFQVLFSVGTPMDQILSTLQHQAQHPGLKNALITIHREVESGTRLSAAFAKHPRYFSPLYVSLLEVGESGGVLDKTLKEMTSILDKEARLKTKVKSATLYPKIALVAIVAVAIFLVTSVVPIFQGFYNQYGAQLPLPTRILLTISQAIRHYWFLWALGAGGIIGSWISFLKTERGKTFHSTLQLHMPVFGRIHRLTSEARLGHLLASLYNAGLPLAPALTIVANTLENKLFSADLVKARESLQQGSSLANALRQQTQFSPLLIQSVAVGEQTGNLNLLLEATAQYYDEEIEDWLKNLSTLIEPLMLLILFGMVTLLALAFFLPIWNLTRVVLPASGG